MSRKFLQQSATAAFLVLCTALFLVTELSAEGVKITKLDGKLRIEINGQLFTEYHYEGAPHVYYYPLLGPGQLPMTRNYPMKNVEGENQDHPHHRSLWYSHGDVNGIDFWAENDRAGRIVHDEFLEIASGEKEGVIRSTSRWVDRDGKVICRDERVFRVYNRPANERLLDFDVTIMAGDEKLVLGDTKEGTMALRLNETMRLSPNKFNEGKPTGRIVMNTGVRDGATWGQRAAWCDYFGPVEGKILGAAIFDHPDNPKHPTWWHVRDYGLFAANPFGIHYFEKAPEGAGDIEIPAGQSVTWRYRIYLHEGDEKQADVAGRYRQYVSEK
jgi:hypothetical protein